MDPILVSFRPKSDQIKVQVTERYGELFPTYYVTPPISAVKVFQINNDYLISVDEDFIKTMIHPDKTPDEVYLYPKIMGRN